MTQFSVKNSYRRNVLALMTGSAIGQALPIAASPILTRLYTPEDFGIAALFLSIAAVLATVVNGRYELAIGLPESDDDAINVAALGAVIAILVSIALLALVFFFGKNLALMANAESIIPWLYLIPASVLLTGIFNVLNYTNNRLGLFNDIATANVYKSIASTGTQMFGGWLIKGASGLIFGNLAAQLVSNFKLYRNTSTHFKLRNISKNKMWTLAKRYKNFPKFSMWAGVFNALGHHILIFAMPIVFSIGTLGLYNLATRVLGAPAALISSAFGQVFLREATQERRENGHAKSTFNKTVRRLTIIGAPIFFSIYMFSEPLFGFIFGPNWREAGAYAAIMTPLLYTQFVVSTVSMMNVVFEKNHIGLYWQISLATISFGLVYTAYAFEWSFINYLRISSLVLAAHYLALLVIMSTYNQIMPDLKK